MIANGQIANAQQRLATSNSINYFNVNPLKTSTINNNDTVVFDLSQATCVGQYFSVPVSVISDDVINAVDFSMKYNNTKITYNSVLNYKPAYLTPSANFNTTDSILRFTSYSFIQPIEKNVAIAAVRFNLLNGPIVTANFNNVKAYLNGDRCSIKFINAVLPTATITPNGPTTIYSGDSVSLTANAGTGLTYLWSTASTKQTIKVFTAATYTVTVSNTGGCTANAVTTVFVSTPLPVELLYFNVAACNTGVKIDWSTATENDNLFFTIEHSGNGHDWHELAKINSQGNVNSITNYAYLDTNPVNDLNYYRLKQTDVNGSIHFLASKSIISKKDQVHIPQLLIAPNPASGFVKITASVTTTLQLHNATGFPCLTPIVMNANKEVVINIAMLPNGVYSLKAIDNYSCITSKIIIVNK